MTKHDSKTAESVTLRSRGVSSCGEVLVGSIQVQAIMQSMVDDYELALKNQHAELVELRKKNSELVKLCGDCADYIDINRCSSIGYNSIFHKQLREQAKQLKGGDL